MFYFPLQRPSSCGTVTTGAVSDSRLLGVLALDGSDAVGRGLRLHTSKSEMEKS